MKQDVYFFCEECEREAGKVEEMKRQRYHFVDNIRGITLLSMVVYHAVWDLVYIFGWNLEWYDSMVGYFWQQSICWTFILLSGFCWCLSRRKLRRGFVVFGGGLLITAVTLLVMPQNRVVFGVLTLLGTCMLLQVLLEPLWKKCNSFTGLLSSFVLFMLFRNINQGYMGIGEMELLELPQDLYDNLFTTFLGFTERGFFSTDYFSLIPWYFLFLTGYFLYRFLQEKELLKKIPNIHFLPLEWLGKNSLLLYLLHQPVVYGVLSLVM